MKKDVCILMGSPRKGGNTMHLLTPFIRELEAAGCACRVIWLYDGPAALPGLPRLPEGLDGVRLRHTGRHAGDL